MRAFTKPADRYSGEDYPLQSDLLPKSELPWIVVPVMESPGALEWTVAVMKLPLTVLPETSVLAQDLVAGLEDVVGARTGDPALDDDASAPEVAAHRVAGDPVCGGGDWCWGPDPGAPGLSPLPSSVTLMPPSARFPVTVLFSTLELVTPTSSTALLVSMFGVGFSPLFSMVLFWRARFVVSSAMIP